MVILYFYEQSPSLSILVSHSLNYAIACTLFIVHNQLVFGLRMLRKLVFLWDFPLSWKTLYQYFFSLLKTCWESDISKSFSSFTLSHLVVGPNCVDLMVLILLCTGVVAARGTNHIFVLWRMAYRNLQKTLCATYNISLIDPLICTFGNIMVVVFCLCTVLCIDIGRFRFWFLENILWSCGW